MQANLLKAEMVAKGKKQKDLAGVLSLRQSSISNRLTGRIDFTVSEAQRIVEWLDLSAEKAKIIFFS